MKFGNDRARFYYMVIFRIPPLKKENDSTIKETKEPSLKIIKSYLVQECHKGTAQLACVGCLLRTGGRGVVLLGARTKCVSKEHGLCLKEQGSTHSTPGSYWARIGWWVQVQGWDEIWLANDLVGLRPWTGSPQDYQPSGLAIDCHAQQTPRELLGDKELVAQYWGKDEREFWRIIGIKMAVVRWLWDMKGIWNSDWDRNKEFHPFMILNDANYMPWNKSEFWEIHVHVFPWHKSQVKCTKLYSRHSHCDI